ncbi:metabolite traffic protein EboE [Tamlana sp. 2201CG12-4]|uniref:metabolite traffic protein EboE n=1 Tax=Tamlana sp. 2201CG12-4 TaxID=3112582 RepID=UPI002DBC7968|nr:metabolite traffic protein EboE [Tamlana sp. 2201CG12-4]MEC3905674.1 metabolite traffic protein EboE [Tamlana sp. 2201CG12-4]
MIIEDQTHLTYCTNIHSGETWEEIFDNLKNYTVKVKERLNSDKPFGIGLRLSQKSASVLLQGNNLTNFKTWLDTNNLYVFTMNGFPYGEFHNTTIKDQVHTPDWTTENRVSYTQNLMNILAYLLPKGMEGSVSTSPLSYKHWFNNQTDLDKTTKKSCQSLIQIVLQLIDIRKATGKLLHLDLEPEPDGFLENTQEVIDFYKDHLFKEGVLIIQKRLGCKSEEAKAYILEHIQVCYDICHFALAYESPKFVISNLQNEGIKIGKIQISAAIKCQKSDTIPISSQQSYLRQFDEPTYLHQSVVKLDKGNLVHFSDLSEGIDFMTNAGFKEIRTHFHIPIFISNFQVLKSTQNEIIDALNLWKEIKYSNHLEIETYTWSILPEHLQTDITSSIVREFEWVVKQLSN